MTTWAQAEEERYRLDVLRLLAHMGGYEANHRTIGAALRTRGHHRSADDQADALHWLARRGLVETREEAGFVVARLTERGGDTAAGRETVPGVARPMPGDE